MSPEEFCRWLQGFAELTSGPPDVAQWQSIKEHLQLVFCKVTAPVDHNAPAPISRRPRVTVDEKEIRKLLGDPPPHHTPLIC